MLYGDVFPEITRTKEASFLKRATHISNLDKVPIHRDGNLWSCEVVSMETNILVASTTILFDTMKKPLLMTF